MPPRHTRPTPRPTPSTSAPTSPARAPAPSPSSSSSPPTPPTPPAPDSSPAPLHIIEPVCAVFRRALKAEGLKYTPERANVLNVVMQFEGLFEADQVLVRVKADGFRVSKATVYRTLKLLADAGIVQRVLIDSDQAHYQLVFGHTRPRHILVRADTGHVIEIDIPELDAIVAHQCAALGLQPSSFRLHVLAHAATT